MSREEVVVCIDNSEYMRNGDYSPTRIEAQQDAANMICGAKTQQHPESTLAIITMAGKSPNVQVALTNDLGKLLATLSSIQVQGTMNFTTTMRVAQLVLKRKSSEQASSQKRIIVFVGSPLTETTEQLQQLGAELQKKNIAVDVVNFGEEKLNTEKLEAFINAVKSENNSRLETVPPGPHILSDMLLRSPIILGEGAAAAAAAGGGESTGYEFGVDPNVDPELVLALRLSMEEERRRQDRQTQPAAGSEGGAPQPTTPAPAQTQSAPAPTHQDEDDIEMDDDELLQQAINMSKQQSTPAASQPAAQTGGEQMEDEDEDLRLALELSKQQPQQKEENIQDILQDEDYLNDVIGSLPGVNPEKKKKEEDEKK